MPLTPNPPSSPQALLQLWGHSTDQHRENEGFEGLSPFILLFTPDRGPSAGKESRDGDSIDSPAAIGAEEQPQPWRG